jgi:hypothetical protein
MRVVKARIIARLYAVADNLDLPMAALAIDRASRIKQLRLVRPVRKR